MTGIATVNLENSFEAVLLCDRCEQNASQNDCEAAYLAWQKWSRCILQDGAMLDASSDPDAAGSLCLTP